MTDQQIDARKREIDRLWMARNGGDICGCAQFATPEEEREYEELNLREMINSDFCYGDSSCSGIYDDRTGKWNERYGFPYAEKIGLKRALEVFNEQRAFLREHAERRCRVYTDHEGCTYNSLVWK